MFDWKERERERLNVAIFKDAMDTIALNAGVDPAIAIKQMRQRIPVVPVAVSDQVLLLLAIIEHLNERITSLEAKS